MICSKCGQDKEAHHQDKHMCVDCSHAEGNRVTYYRQHQGDWIAEAKEQGLCPWLQQPGETQWEYTVWVAFRDSYPGGKPTYSAVAEKLNTSYDVVRKIAQRWSFPLRMQLWVAECDRITMIQRKDEILNMNKEHIDMATTLRDKLNIAIGQLDPAMLKPSEIVAMAKLYSDLERKARIDAEAQDAIRRELLVDTAGGSVKKQQTNQGDLGEVLEILMKAGALPNAIGVRETTTTKELVVRRESEDL